MRMSDRTFQVFMAVAGLLMFVVMSTPLTGVDLSDLAARMRSSSAAPRVEGPTQIAQN